MRYKVTYLKSKHEKSKKQTRMTVGVYCNARWFISISIKTQV